MAVTVAARPLRHRRSKMLSLHLCSDWISQENQAQEGCWLILGYSSLLTCTTEAQERSQCTKAPPFSGTIDHVHVLSDPTTAWSLTVAVLIDDVQNSLLMTVSNLDGGQPATGQGERNLYTNHVFDASCRMPTQTRARLK